MQNIIEIFQENLTGNNVLDAIIIGILFAVFRDFYIMLFSAMFEPFKRNR